MYVKPYGVFRQVLDHATATVTVNQQLCAWVGTHSQSMVRLPSGLCRLTLQMKLAKEPPCSSSSGTQQYIRSKGGVESQPP